MQLLFTCILLFLQCKLYLQYLCLRSLDLYYTVSFHLKRDKTSWTVSICGFVLFVWTVEGREYMVFKEAESQELLKIWKISKIRLKIRQNLIRFMLCCLVIYNWGWLSFNIIFSVPIESYISSRKSLLIVKKKCCFYNSLCLSVGRHRL